MEPRKYSLKKAATGVLFLVDIQCPFLHQEGLCGDWCPHFEFVLKDRVTDGYGRPQIADWPHVKITCSGIEKIIQVETEGGYDGL